jgi:hypothetical protein
MPRPAEIQKALIANIEESVSFDSVLTKNSKIEKLAAQYLTSVLFNPDPSSRSAEIANLQRDIVTHFDSEIVPAATALGRRQAREVIRQIGGGRPPLDLNDEADRRRILFEGDMRAEQRVRIVQVLTNDAGNTLDNRLAAFWLEPGTTPEEKLATLRRLHDQQEQARKSFDDRMEQFRDGKGSRPRRPQLDYLSRFTSHVMTETNVQARRTGTDAEHATFESQGFKRFTWVTVNAGDACPDCRKRQGTTGDMAYFEKIGKPGAGKTVCGSACFCLLVPSETIYHAPGLARGIETPSGGEGGGGGVRTDPEQQRQIEAQKIEPPPAPLPPAKSPVERLQAAMDADTVSKQLHAKALKAVERQRKEGAKARAKIDELTAQWEEIHGRAFDPVTGEKNSEVIKELHRIDSELGKAMDTANNWERKAKEGIWRTVQVPRDKRFDKIIGETVQNAQPGGMSNVPAKLKGARTGQAIKEGNDFARRLWQRPPEFGSQPTHSVRYSEHARGYRANHYAFEHGTAGRNLINVQENEAASVVVHELGHEIEARQPNGNEIAKAFLDMRTKGQPIRKLRDVMPTHGYGPDEKGQDDDFAKAFGADSAWYVGKRYDFPGSEVISMGIEKLFAAPIQLLEADGEYFRFLIGFLHGRLSV